MATSVTSSAKSIAAIEVWDFLRRPPVGLEGKALGKMWGLDHLQEGDGQTIHHGLAEEGAERPSLPEATSESQELTEPPGAVPGEEVP